MKIKNVFNNLGLILQGIGVFFFLVVLAIMVFFHIFYELFDIKLIFILTTFLLFLLFWLIVSLKGMSILNVKLEENEKVMNLRMQTAFGASTFLIAIAVPFVTSGNLTSDWSHVFLFCFGMLMIIVGFSLWILIYEPRYNKLEKYYLKDNSSKIPD